MAKPRCKVGDRAFIFKSPFQENIGRVVRIMRPSGPDEVCDWQPGDVVWWIKSDGSPLRQRFEDNSTYLVAERCMEDAGLLPIRGRGRAAKTEKRELVRGE